MARQPAVPDASRPALLRLVLRDLVGETLGLLQYLSDRWPSQKVCTQCLILDALCQPLDDGRCLTKGRARFLAGPQIQPVVQHARDLANQVPKDQAEQGGS